MGKIEDAVNLALEIANDDSHGYSQYNRWGPDYDCSSFLIYVWQSCGVPVKTNGATYTGNMLSAFLQSGFRIVDRSVEELQPGDVLLNVVHHTAMYIGGNKIVQASISENGTIHGNPGDQTGYEIAVSSFYEFPWDYVLRYNRKDDYEQIPADVNEFINYGQAIFDPVKMPLLKMGYYGPAVCAMQGALRYHGFLKADKITGGFGTETDHAVREFQRVHKLEIDGECGPITWDELMNWR